MAEPLWKAVWQLLKKLNIELSYDPAIPLLGVYSKKLKAGTETYLYMLFIVSVVLFTTAKR